MSNIIIIHQFHLWVCLVLTSAIACLFDFLLLVFIISPCVTHPSPNLFFFSLSVSLDQCHFTRHERISVICNSAFSMILFNFQESLRSMEWVRKKNRTLFKLDMSFRQPYVNICIFNGIYWWWYLDCSLHKENTCFVLVNKFSGHTKLPLHSTT